MSQNSSDTIDHMKVRRSWRSWAMIILLPLWVFVSFLLAQLLTQGILWVLHAVHVPLDSINKNVMTTILAAFIYLLAIALTIGMPRLVKRRQVTQEELGLHRLPIWRDILMAPAGLVVYLVLSALLILVASAFFPNFTANQHQDTGFTGLNQQYELMLAFVTLVVIAPVAEEILFRGYLFSKLRTYAPVWIAILATSILFGLIHAIGNSGDWSLVVDTFALSVVLCLLRLSTGSLWASMLLHMTKNAIAFFVLFVYPVLHGTIGG